MESFSDYLSTIKGKVTLLAILVTIIGLLIIAYNSIFCKHEEPNAKTYAASTTAVSSSEMSSSQENVAASSKVSSSQVSSSSSSSKPGDVAVKSVDFDVTKKTISKGDSFTLKATITPANATDKTLKWTTTNLDVATVSDDGVVTAVGAGKATIRATNSKSTQRDTCNITVTP